MLSKGQIENTSLNNARRTYLKKALMQLGIFVDEANDGFTEGEILELSEYDEEWGHLKTKSHPHSMSSRELLKRIDEDPDREVFKQYTNTRQLLALLISCSVVVLILLLAEVVNVLPYSFLSEIQPFLLLSLVLVTFLLVVLYYLEGKANPIITSTLGIGWREYGKAIEWSHVEWIDIGIKDGKIKRIIFSGNRRSLWYENAWLNTEFTRADLYKYVPDLDTWEDTPMPGWPDSYSRHTRPEASDM